MTDRTTTGLIPPGSSPTMRRIASIDAYRGFVMFLMMAEVLHLSRVAAALPSSTFWKFLAYHQTHVEWAGCSLHDLIQPSFSFLVGVALPFSIVSRVARGQSHATMIFHAAWRAAVLTLLGVFLRSVGKNQTNWTFEDTLSQIGLGYLPLFLLGLATVRAHARSGGALGNSDLKNAEEPGLRENPDWLSWNIAALAVILLGYWIAFALYLPGADYDRTAVGVPLNWPHWYSGFASHWNKNGNLAWAFDRWFLNQFPREKPFSHNGGGYATLSFIPTLGTMVLGLIAGEKLRRNLRARRNEPAAAEVPAPSAQTNRTTTHWATVAWLFIAGIICLTAGYLLDRFGICPNVKRIWTPGWTLFSGGWCFILLALFYVVLDGMGVRAWSFPLRVIGANSIAAYCIAHLWDGFVIQSFKTHLGEEFFSEFGKGYGLLLQGGAVLAVYWLILFWMYRRGIFLRI